MHAVSIKSYFYSVNGTTDDSRRNIIIATTLGGGVYLCIVVIAFLVKYQRWKRASGLSIPVNIPQNATESLQEPLPIYEVNW
jgi:hypothetical protein